MKNTRILLTLATLAGMTLVSSLTGCSTAAKTTATVDDTIYFHGGKCSEHACSLKRDSNGNVVVTNEKGESGYGYVRDTTKIHITGWNNLEGTLSYFDGKISAIYWYSGVNWLKD